MAVVGMLGGVVFQASDQTVKTFTNFQWSGSSRYETHQRHLGRALTEFIGVDPETASMSITLSSYLGVNPLAEIEAIRLYQSAAIPIPLVLGNRIYGAWRWVITKFSVSGKFYDAAGTMTHCTVSVSLQEYLPF